jgi:hypothetical protein
MPGAEGTTWLAITSTVAAIRSAMPARVRVFASGGVELPARALLPQPPRLVLRLPDADGAAE